MADKAQAVALITGAASGIGRAAARQYALDGWIVAAVDIAGPKLDETVAALPGEGHQSIGLDLGALGSAQDLIDQVVASVGPPTLVMNNAATRIGRGMDASLDDWRALFEVNFWAMVETCRLIAPLMQAGAGGAIVNVGSKQGITNPPGHPAYNIAKSAVKTYTEALAHDLRGAEGAAVTAHLLIPGWTTTGDAAHKPGAWLPEQVVQMMRDGVATGDFYILCPDDETTTDMDHRRISWAAGDITENRPALSRWHPDWAETAKKACS